MNENCSLSHKRIQFDKRTKWQNVRERMHVPKTRTCEHMFWIFACLPNGKMSLSLMLSMPQPPHIAKKQTIWFLECVSFHHAFLLLEMSILLLIPSTFNGTLSLYHICHFVTIEHYFAVVLFLCLLSFRKPVQIKQSTFFSIQVSSSAKYVSCGCVWKNS